VSAAAFVLGAVAYDPKVVTIWEGFKEHFPANGLPFDYVLFSNYESQVEAHLAGQIDAAWNSPLAHIETERVAKVRGIGVEAVAMRDTDQDLTSIVLVKESSGIHAMADLKGKKIGVGAADSPQATLLPLLHLAEAGVEPGRDVEVVQHDRLVGKHGDHIGGERDAAKALLAGTVDAAAVIDGNQLLFARERTLPADSVRILARTAPYDHCCFTVLGTAPRTRVTRFTELLLSMSYDDPAVRPLLDLEGLKQWRTGRTTGYAALGRAVDRFGTLAPWLGRMGAA
jgi:ABC-type phosphate/phosphonate transport system substrate-binding protein